MVRGVVVGMDGRPFRGRRAASRVDRQLPAALPVRIDAHVGPWREAGPPEQPAFVLRAEADVLGVPMDLVACRVFAPVATGKYVPESDYEWSCFDDYGIAWNQEALDAWMRACLTLTDEDSQWPIMPEAPRNRVTRAARRLVRRLMGCCDDPDALLMVRGASAYTVTGVARRAGKVPERTPAWFQFSRSESVRAALHGEREFVEFPVNVSGCSSVLTLRLLPEMDRRPIRLLMPDALRAEGPPKVEWRGLLWHAELWPCVPGESAYWASEPRFVADISRTDPIWLQGAERVA